MVHAGFRVAGRDSLDPPPAQSAPDQHDEENMDARPDQEEMEQAAAASYQQIPAAVGEAGDNRLQGPGHPTVSLAQACTRVSSLHICG